MEYAKAVGAVLGGLHQVNAASSLNQPKELGVLQRVDGMRSGLQELRARLERFFDRIDGNAGQKAATDTDVSASLTGALSDAESELRICLQLADTLHDRF